MIKEQASIPAKPEMTDLIALLKKDIFLTLNCHALGTIQKFNSAKQTVEVAINYQKTIFSTDPTQPPTFQNYPALVDCPIVILSGGITNLTFPITVGDTCLVFFNDRDIDTWITSGQIAPVNSSRMHSMADAIALIGVKPVIKAITPYDTTHALISNGVTKLGIQPVANKVLISNTVTTLATVLNGLIDLIAGLQATDTINGNPVVVSPAYIATLNAYKAVILGLLE